MKIYIPLLLISLAWLTISCQKDTLPGNAPEEVQLQVMIAGKQTGTRVSVDGKRFENTDKFRFFFNSGLPTNDDVGTGSGTGVTDEEIKVVDYTYSSSNKWTYSHPIYWDDQEKITDRKFCGIMPFSSYSVDAHTFEVATDQSTEDNYKASDLMIARTKTAKRLIPLKFWHALSRVVVNVTVSIDGTKSESFAEDALNGIVIELYNVYPKATINYGTEPTPDTGEKPEYNPAITVGISASTPANVRMHQTITSTKDESKKELTTSHVAVIPPQNITENTRVLMITLTEGTTKKNYYFKHTGDITFAQHKEMEINVTLNKSKVEATGTITLQPWGVITANGGTIVLPN